MTAFIELKSLNERFARSINVEYDTGGSALDGYIPVGRAVDAVSRIARGLADDQTESAFSVTGPYGSGKSSFAVLLDGLFGPEEEPSRATAHELIATASPEVAQLVEKARCSRDAHKSGFIRAVITAEREPIAATVLRALMHGADRFGHPARAKGQFNAAVKDIREMHAGFTASPSVLPDSHKIKSVIASLAECAPVLLVIDEFGKNLEAFADSHSDADLYLLQQLAEASRGSSALPLVLVTLQHMSFDEYAGGAQVGQRREWAKIQGRFEDIPFVDTAAQTRWLIGAAFTETDKRLTAAVTEWADNQATQLASLGITDLAEEVELVARVWPLHPVALSVLPELCERYGQNERTLFSFLAGSEPGSVASFLRDHVFVEGKALPVVRLDKIYDYFLESAANLVGVSNAASRWVEIDTRIRDAHGLEDSARRVLKTVGLLNLVSAGGSVRASRSIIEFACANGQHGTRTGAQVRKKLNSLEQAGLITYRDYADEYRVWSGSDFDLKAALDMARWRLRDEDPTIVLQRVLPMRPLVAARHFHDTGTLRAFARRWISEDAKNIQPLGMADSEDGIAFYVLGSRTPHREVQNCRGAKPVAFVTSPSPGTLTHAAREVAAFDEVLADRESLGDDWVARRELIERRTEARLEVDRLVEELYGATSESRGDWTFLPSFEFRRPKSLGDLTASQAMSAIADHWYSAAPKIRNDLINRHELSSQLAKARRLLLEAMISKPDEEALGICGSGPDKTLYRTVLETSGLHHGTKKGWSFKSPKPDSPIYETWRHLAELLSAATEGRLGVDELYAELASPPFGVREGVAPILLTAALIINRDELALYEHGTFQPRLTNDLVERLLKNPQNFEVKHFASRTGPRSQLLTAIAEQLQIPVSRPEKRQQVGSVLAVVSHLVRTIADVPPYIKRTAHLEKSTVAVRKHLLEATEPDELLFSAIPAALGFEPVPGRGSYAPEKIKQLALGLTEVVEELRNAYPLLLNTLRAELGDALHGPEDDLQGHLGIRAASLEGQVINPRLKSLVVALMADLDSKGWTEYVAMNVVNGRALGQWDDQDRARFSVELRDIADTFLRVEWLNADLRTRTEGFDALRVAVTRPDGTERVNVVSIDHDRRELLENVVDDAVQLAREYGLSETVARDTLIAILAQDATPAEPVLQLPQAKNPPTLETEDAAVNE